MRKLGLIFIYHKSEVSGQLPEETVRISRLYEAKSLDKLISEMFMYLKFDIYLDLIY